MLEAIFSWNTLYVLLMIIYVPSCVGLIGIVLLQKGKNMGFAGAFGVNPGGDTVLGPRASRSLPVRMTYFMAAAFMTICVLFALIEGRRNQGVAPDKVDPAVAAAEQQITDQLDDLGVAPADPDSGESAAGTLGAVPEDSATEASADAPPVDAPAVDEAATEEPSANAGDVTEAAPESDAQAEVEAMPEDDTP